MLTLSRKNEKNTKKSHEGEVKNENSSLFNQTQLKF